MRILTFSSALVAVMAFGYWAGHRASEVPVNEAFAIVYPVAEYQPTWSTEVSDEFLLELQKRLEIEFPEEDRIKLTALARANYELQKTYSRSYAAVLKRVRCPHLMAVPSRDDGLCLNVETATYSELLCLAGDEDTCSKLPSQ